jgi:hypothetical protein
VTRALIGSSLLVASLAVLAAAVWFLWLVGRGRHRRDRRPGPLLPPGVPGPDGPYGTEAVLLLAPPTPSVLRLQEGEAPETDTVALLAADRADFAHCPAENRRTPHFFHSDGTRTCCRCETPTAGDQT